MPRSGDQISLHEATVYLLLVNNRDRWFTSKELAAEANVSGRSARLFAAKLAEMGIADRLETYPGYRYRIAAGSQRRHAEYIQRLTEVAQVLGARS